MSRSNPIDKDEQLEQALTDVAAIEPDFEKTLYAVAQCDSDYEVEYAKAFLAAEGSVDARKAAAIVKVEKFLREKNKNRAVKEFLREKLRDRQAAVSARQSLLSAEVKTNQRF